MQRLTATLALTIAVLTVQSAQGRVRLENICTVKGQEEIELTGLGLVVGLSGTGDGPKSLPTVKFLGNMLAKYEPGEGAVVDLAALVEAKNVAIVQVFATIPRSGLRRTQRMDCKVSTLMSAKSLKGGRLMATPLSLTDHRDPTMIAMATGEVSIEESLANGRVRNGAKVVVDPDDSRLPRPLVADFVQDGRVTLLLDPTHATFHGASEIARVVNGEFSFEANGRDIARATRPGEVVVEVVETYRDTPVDFIAQLLDVAVETPHAQAKVVVNERTKVVIVTGEVEISPVVITHENLTITVGGPPPGLPEPQPGFVQVTNDTAARSPQKLQDLVTALNGLKVPTEDVIEILRELHHSGKLHAEFVEN